MYVCVLKRNVLYCTVRSRLLAEPSRPSTCCVLFYASDYSRLSKTCCCYVLMNDTGCFVSVPAAQHGTPLAAGFTDLYDALRTSSFKPQIIQKCVLV